MARKKVYVFGYGSLANADDVARTLGRLPSFIHPAKLEGWVREWGLVIRNDESHRCVRLPDGTVAPGYIAVLNVRRPMAGETPTDPNGVLFEVDDEDLLKIDAREQHYRRLDVTRHVRGAPEGIVYTYTGLDKFLIANHDGSPTVIPANYSELVSSSFMLLGPDGHELYVSTTLPSDLPLQ